MPDPIEAALAAQRARAARLKACMSDVDERLIADRRRARALSASRRSSALRVANRRAAQGDAACRRRHGRIPGRVETLRASATGRGTIRLSFKSVGTNNKNAPAAQRYLVKQSLRPIRTKRDFDRAFALCSGGCSFKITRIGASLDLTVNRLRSGRRYHYAIAARDNVSSLPGPRSRTISARTR